MRKVGDFSCDLWWATAVDKSVLIKIMTEGGSEDAESDLETYLKSNDAYASNVLQIKVKPGRWKIHFGPDFAEQVDREAMGIPKNAEPWLILEPVT